MTKQMEDLLYYQGREYFVGTYIMESYFTEHPKRRPKVDVHETCLWRGHLATFEVREEQLFLTELEVLTDGKAYMRSVLEEVFPGAKKMDWYSGMLPLEEPHPYLVSKQDSFFYLEMKQGNLIRERKFNRTELEAFKEEQFGYFQMTDDFLELAKRWRLKQPQLSAEEIAEIIRDRILYYSKEIFVD